jgi:hypothetical protein
MARPIFFTVKAFSRSNELSPKERVGLEVRFAQELETLLGSEEAVLVLCKAAAADYAAAARLKEVYADARRALQRRGELAADCEFSVRLTEVREL